MGLRPQNLKNLTLLKFAKVDVLFLMFFCLQSPNKIFIDIRTKDYKNKGGRREQLTAHNNHPQMGLQPQNLKNLTLLKFAKVDILFLMFFCLQNPNGDLLTSEHTYKFPLSLIPFPF